MKTVIVFGNDHTNTVGVIQSLGVAGYRSIGLLYGNKTGYVKSSKYVDLIISAENSQSCVEKLLQHPKYKKRMPIIACCDDAALTLERNKIRLEDLFVFEYASNYTLQYISNKEKQIKHAKDAGFNVPKTWILNDKKIVPEDVTYPCLIKPLISCEGAKSDIRICKSYDDLIINLNSLNVTKDVLLQQYIDRDYEISILGCGLSNGDCIIPAVENKLTLYPKYVGLVCLAYLEPIDLPEIKESILKLIQEIGYVGLFSVEMMHCKTDDRFYFTEINLRNDGANFFITKFGANLPLNHIEDLMSIPLTSHKKYNPGYYIWDMHHLRSFLSRDISIKDWLKEIRKSKGFLMYCKEDKKPFFRQYFYMLGRLLRTIKVSRYD